MRHGTNTPSPVPIVTRTKIGGAPPGISGVARIADPINAAPIQDPITTATAIRSEDHARGEYAPATGAMSSHPTINGRTDLAA